MSAASHSTVSCRATPSRNCVPGRAGAWTSRAAGFEPMALRYLLLTAHYRSKLNFINESIEAAQNGLNNLRADLAALPEEDGHAGYWSDEALRAREAFHEAINDDLDLPVALS